MDKRSVIGFSLGPILGAAIGLATVPTMAWLFSVEDIGRLNVLMVALSFVVLFFSFGLDQSFVREYFESKNRVALLAICMLPGLVLFAFCLVPVVLARDALAQWLFASQNPILVAALISACCASLLCRFLSLVLRMEGRGFAYSASQVLQKLSLVVGIAVIYFAGVDRTFVSLSVAVAASHVILLGYLLVSTRLDWSLLRTRPGVERILLRPLLRYGWPLAIEGICYWCLIASSTFALRLTSSFEQLGFYTIAISCASVALVFQAIVSTIWAPVVYRWAASGDNLDRVGPLARRAGVAVSVLLVLVGSMSWVIDLLLPATYSDISMLVVCAMIQPLLYTLSELTGVGINLMRRTTLSLLSTVSALGLNVGLSFALVPSLGAQGAILANSAAFLLFFVVRTELSAAVWRSFSRSGTYLLILPLCSIAASLAAVGRLLPFHPSVVWIILFAPIAVVCRREFTTVAGAKGVRRWQF